MPTDSPLDPIQADWPTLDVLCVRYIERVLARVGGNKTRAARVLGVNPRTMRRITVTMARGRTPNINTGHNTRGAHAATRAPAPG